MGRALRTVAGGLAYHVLNRANAQMRIPDDAKDHEAFDQILAEAVLRVKMHVLAYCVMPNHWHLYQGRFKSFLVESDEHLWTVCRYVERNALRAGLCARAEQWRWSSLWRREFGDVECRQVLSKWPIDVPKDWVNRVNRAESRSQLEALRRCVNRRQPFGGGVETGLKRGRS